MIKTIWATFCLMLLGAVLIFYVFQKSYTNMLFNLALQPKVKEVLENAMEDQRRLSSLDPAGTTQYRERFEGIKRLRDNYYILEQSREDMASTFQVALMSMLGGIILFSGGFYFVHHRRQVRRLSALQSHLLALSEGEVDILVEDKGRDLLGQIGRMIEKTSGVLAKQRRRLGTLDSLAAWQEAARRHAHEIRTPLTAARMELNALVRYVAKEAPALAEKTSAYQDSVNEELDRLKEFTQSFTSFAKIGKPKIQEISLYQLMDQFVATFVDAWPNMSLNLVDACRDLLVRVDKDMVRQVLVNLCNNSSLAVVDQKGQVTFEIKHGHGAVFLDVCDDGPGIQPELVNSLFKPYTTSRKIGEGMGLGLSIAKKILLDHGGDLVLHATSPKGVCFRLIFVENPEDMDTWQ